MPMVDTRLIYSQTNKKVQKTKNEIEDLAFKIKEKEKELESLLLASALLQEIIPPPRGIDIELPGTTAPHSSREQIDSPSPPPPKKHAPAKKGPSIPIQLVRDARPGNDPLKPGTKHHEVHAVIKEFKRISNKELQEYFSETNERSLASVVSCLYRGNYIKKEPSFGRHASPVYIYNSDIGYHPNKYVSKRILKIAMVTINRLHKLGKNITPINLREGTGIPRQSTGRIISELLETGFIEKIGKKTYQKSKKWLDAEPS